MLKFGNVKTAGEQILQRNMCMILISYDFRSCKAKANGRTDVKTQASDINTISVDDYIIPYNLREVSF